jgi:hypothetical protein
MDAPSAMEIHFSGDERAQHQHDSSSTSLTTHCHLVLHGLQNDRLWKGTRSAGSPSGQHSIVGALTGRRLLFVQNLNTPSKSP